MLCRGKVRVDGCMRGVVEAWRVGRLRRFGRGVDLLLGVMCQGQKRQRVGMLEWVSQGTWDGLESPWLSQAGSIGSQDVSCG